MNECRLLILDRDGVINRAPLPPRPFILQREEFFLLPNVAAALGLAKRAGIKLALATNQSCVGQGLINDSQLHAIHDYMQSLLAPAAGTLDKIYYAPDKRENPSPRRKPGSGMLLEALRDFSIQPQYAWMVGDHDRDIAAAYGADCHRVLVQTDPVWPQYAARCATFAPVKVMPDLPATIDYIVRYHAPRTASAA